MTFPSADASPSREKLILTPEQKAVRAWVLAHRGEFRRIAAAHGVSVQFVHMIAYGKEGRRSSGLRVERALEALGCPVRIRTR